MKYKSKVDWWYYIFVLLFSFCTFNVFYCFTTTKNLAEHSLLFTLFLVCEFIIILPNLLCTYYVLGDETVYVRSGCFYYKDIPYNDIVKVRDTKAIFSACGLAMDRIELTYKYKDSIDIVLISPKEKDEFKEKLSKKVTITNAKDLSSFVKQDQENDGKNQPVNGIFR